MVFKEVLSFLGKEEEEYICVFTSHEEATLGRKTTEEFDPYLDNLFKETKRFALKSVDGMGTHYIDVDLSAPHFRLPIIENGKRVKGKFLLLFLHDAEGRLFGVNEKGETVLPHDVKREIENLRLNNNNLAVKNFTLLEALNTLTDEDRMRVLSEQKALEHEYLRKKYNVFIPGLQGMGEQKR